MKDPFEVREKLLNAGKEEMDEFFNKCKKTAFSFIKNIEHVVAKKDLDFIMKKGEETKKQNLLKERRSSERMYIRIPVYIHTEDSIYMDYSVDISEGGIGLEGLDPLEKGKKVNLRMFFSQENQLDTVAEVAWARRENTNKTLGFCFKDLSPEVKNYIQNLKVTSKSKQPSDS